MTRYLALLRGINLGATNKLPMAQLRELADGLGWTDVVTHAVSGNLVFSAAPAVGSAGALEAALAAEVERAMGKPIQVLVLPGEEFATLVEQCPFTPTELKLVHLQLHRCPLPEAVAVSVAELLATADDGTEAEVNGRVLYLHTPHGFSRSVVFGGLGRLLPADDPGTARNLNVSAKLVQLLRV